ncbi:glycosyltransferase family 92 protein, partial [Candidatus Protochlamydia amoebophila]
MYIFKLINLNFMFNNINHKYSKLKLKLILIFIFIFIFILCAFQKIEGIEAQKSLAICTLFQNESKYLPEWIEFHENQGVSHFFLYNHFCTENWQDI